MKHMSRSQRDVAGLVVKLLGISTSATSNHRTLIVGTDPMQISPYHHPCLFGEGPCNMGESQHEPTVEISKAQEDLLACFTGSVFLSLMESTTMTMA
jgi:hypothetical protein